MIVQVQLIFTSACEKISPSLIEIHRLYLQMRLMLRSISRATGAIHERYLLFFIFSLFFSNTLASYGWSDYGYAYTPDPSLYASSELQHLSGPDSWHDLWSEEILGGFRDNFARGKNQLYARFGIKRRSRAIPSD